MTVVADLELPTYDYMDPELRGPRFHEVMEDLRGQNWLVRVDPVGYLVLDREAVAHILRTPEATFPGRIMLEAQGVDSGALYERMKGNLLDLQGDAHRRLRKLVQPAFTPAEADRRRPRIKEILEELFGAVAAERRCDFVDAFAKPLPTYVVTDVMGAPREDAARLYEWANLIQAQFDPIRIANEMDLLNQAAVEFTEYARGLLEKRRAEPADDMLSQLLATEVDGDRLTEDECVALVSAVLVGGIDTTQSELAHGMRLFAEHPEQWRALADDPSLVPAAVEEVLRYEPITPLTARITLQDVEYRDVTFPKGTLVAGAIVSANRDDAEYEAPDRFDITASRGRTKPLTFGAGPHFCLGMNLARAELEEAFAFLSQRMPDLGLEGEPEYDTPLGVYGLLKLPLRWGEA
jgi:cytochrome P450